MAFTIRPGLTKERKDEIAELYLAIIKKQPVFQNEDPYQKLKDLVAKEGIKTLEPLKIQSMIEETTRQIRIPLKEAQRFARELVLELVQTAFPIPKSEGRKNE